MPNSPSFLQRHDIGVLVIALAILAGGALVHRSLAAPALVPYANSGLRFERPGGWLPAKATRQKPSPLARTGAGFGVPAAAPAPVAVESDDSVHTIYGAPQDARRRIEVRIEKRPTYSNLRGALAVQRLGQYGEFYWARSSGNAAIASRDWLRTEFRYAFKPSKSGSPQIAEAVEYAIVNDGRLYVVTLHASPSDLAALDSLVAQTLQISSQQKNPENSEETRR